MAKILFLSHHNAETPVDIGHGFEREFTKNGAIFLNFVELYAEHGYSGTQAFLKGFIAKNGIDVLIFAPDSTSFYFPLEFFRSLRPAVYTVITAGDTAYYFDVRDKFYGGAVDLLAAYDSYETVAELNRLGGEAVVLLSSYELSRYYKTENRTKTIDVSFVGGLAGRKDRKDCIDHLLKNGIDVQVYGFGAPGGQVSQQRMVEIFNNSRINLNFTDTSVPTYLTKVPPGRKQLKGRIAEVPLCGSFMLSETAPGIENILVPGTEMSVFSDKEDLLGKVRHYLSHEQEREAIAERGYQRARRDYDLSVTVPKFLADIEQRRRLPRKLWAGVSPDDTFNRNFSSFRALMLIRFIKSFRLGLAAEEFSQILKYGAPEPGQLYTFLVAETVDKFPRVKKALKSIFGMGGKA